MRDETSASKKFCNADKREGNDRCKLSEQPTACILLLKLLKYYFCCYMYVHKLIHIMDTFLSFVPLELLREFLTFIFCEKIN